MDTLLVLAVTFATAWVGLVVISAAANDDATTVTANTHGASSPTVDPTTDPSQGFAGPVSTGRPAAPTTEQQVLVAPVPVIAAPRTTAPRVDPEHTTTHAGPRTTPPPAPGTTVAPAVAAAVTSGATTSDPTTAATTTPAETTTPTETATPTATDTTSETPTTSATETTTSSPTTSSPAPAG